jgi:Family of unknown function (DUF6404)
MKYEYEEKLGKAIGELAQADPKASPKKKRAASQFVLQGKITERIKLLSKQAGISLSMAVLIGLGFRFVLPYYRSFISNLVLFSAVFFGITLGISFLLDVVVPGGQPFEFRFAAPIAAVGSTLGGIWFACQYRSIAKQWGLSKWVELG